MEKTDAKTMQAASVRIFKEMANCLPARKGTLCRVMVKKTREDGTVRENGPYLVWKRCEGGKVKATYVSAENEARYRKEIENGKRLKTLIDELMCLTPEEGRGENKNIAAAAPRLAGECLGVAERVESGGAGVMEAETALRDASHGFAAEILGGILSGPAQRAAGVDAPAGRRGLRETSVLSLVGPVRFTRAYVRKDGESSFPADFALMITRGFTPGAAALALREAAGSQSFLQAAKNLEAAAGLSASPDAIHALVSAVGPDMEKWAGEREPAPPPEEGRDIIQVVELDMTGIRLRREYLAGVKGKNGEPTCRQVKCGTVFLAERDAEGRYRRLPGSSVHTISFKNTADFSADLEAARKKLGAGAGRPLIVIADGAEWIWKAAADRFPEAEARIVDFWHAADHLKDLCDFAGGAPEESAALFKKMRHILKTRGADPVIRHFSRLPVKTRRKALLRRLLRYFETHRDRMQYQTYAEKGWPIGSGAIEGACKSLIKQRTDLSGQRWSPNGALNILWARALITDGLFDAYWQTPRDRESTVRETDAAA